MKTLSIRDARKICCPWELYEGQEFIGAYNSHYEALQALSKRKADALAQETAALPRYRDALEQIAELQGNGLGDVITRMRHIARAALEDSQ